MYSYYLQTETNFSKPKNVGLLANVFNSNKLFDTKDMKVIPNKVYSKKQISLDKGHQRQMILIRNKPYSQIQEYNSTIIKQIQGKKNAIKEINSSSNNLLNKHNYSCVMNNIHDNYIMGNRNESKIIINL